MTLEETIASEVMDVIERERRINKDDLIMAARMAIMKHDQQKAVKATTFGLEGWVRMHDAPLENAAQRAYRNASMYGFGASVVAPSGKVTPVSTRDWMKV